MSRTTRKYLPKWRLSKFYYDRMMIERDDKRKEEEALQGEETQQEDDSMAKLSAKFNNPDWLYDNMLISYDELIKLKKKASQ